MSKKIDQDKITLNIIKDGELWVVNVYRNQGITDLIYMALTHFLNPTECLSSSLKYKLTSVPQNKILNLQSTVEDEEIKNSEELLLVSISSCGPIQKKLSSNDIKGPSQEEINNATENLISQNPVQMIPALHCQENLQSEISKVLFSLVEASAKIIALKPDSEAVFDKIISRINGQINREIDKDAVKYLKDLGFNEFQAKYALSIKRNRQVDAAEWLLENHNFLKEVTDRPAKVYSSSSIISDIDSPLYKIKLLLEDIQDYHQQYFEPNHRAMDNLTKMGFKASDVFEALRVCNNNQVDACSWLCGERDSFIANKSVKLDTDSQLYKALMDNPTIQMGLYNPKIMHAFLLILENPANANMWLNDVDTAPVLGQIFKIYHSEKHIMIVNQQIELMNKQQTQS